MTARPAETPRRGRPPRIDRERIVDAAREIDPDTLTMAAVASALGVSTSALYRWVDDREALLDLVSARAAERMLPAWAPDEHTWRAWVTEWAHRTREELAAVPGYAVRVLTGPHRAPGHTALEHRATQAFRAAGATPDQARQFWYLVSASVLGWIAAEQAGRFPSEATPDFATLLDVLLRGVEAAAHP